MKKLFLFLLLVPALLSLQACGGLNGDNLPQDNGVDQITNNTDGDNGGTPDPTENTPDDDSDGPEIAEENPCQGIPGGCPEIQLTQVPTGILTAVAVGKSAELKDALALHAAVINGYQGHWSQASNSEKAAMVASVEDSWDKFVGYDSLSELKADVEAYPEATLNDFLRFYVDTVYRGPDGNSYQVQFEAVGGMNLAAFQYLKDAVHKLHHGNPAGGAQDLLAFAEMFPKPKLVLQTAFLRIHLESAAKTFGLKEYFGKVSATDPAYEAVSQKFWLPLAVDLYQQFKNYGAGPGKQYQTCNVNPHCGEEVVDAYGVMVYNLPTLWEKVAFKMTDANGQTRIFSILNFVHVPSNGKKFGLARGTFGVFPIETLKLVKDNEL